MEHMLISGGFFINTRIGVEFDIDKDFNKLRKCFDIAEKILDDIMKSNEVKFDFN